MLTTFLLILGVIIVASAATYDILVFRSRHDQIYDFARNDVCDYLEDEKDFIYGEFLQTISTWDKQHGEFVEWLKAGPWVLLLSIVFPVLPPWVPGVILLVLVGLLLQYVFWFLPHKRKVYNQVNYWIEQIDKYKHEQAEQDPA